MQPQLQAQPQALRQQSLSSGASSRTRRYPLFIFLTLVVIAMIAAMVPSNSIASELTGCDGSTLVRRLTLVDEGGTDPVTIEIARAEVESIWATAGVRLLWVSGASSATPRPDAYVVLRAGRANVMKDAAMMRSGWFNQLGWVRFDRHGARSNLVEVSLANVRLSLMYAWYGDGRLAYQPEPARIRVFGRALGRIIAHEFGHWLLGQGHESEGLMKTVLQPHELMREEAPRLPVAWTAPNDTSDSRMARLRAVCG